MRFFEVGGCVRDELMGIPRDKINDIDFSVEAESFDEMRSELKRQGFDIFVETLDKLCIRARFPKDHPEFGRKTADFVLCRKDGPYSDNRRPDFVEPGTVFDDLARRDFKMNAIARDLETGELIDPHDGQFDIAHRQISFVGEAMERIEDDGLRVLRAIRFAVTKDFVMTLDTAAAVNSSRSAELLAQQEMNRIREEIEKMFRHDTMKSMEFLEHFVSPEIKEAIFRNNTLRLLPTTGSKVKDKENAD